MDRITGQRMSRGRLFELSLGALAVAPVLAACRSEAQPTVAPTIAPTRAPIIPASPTIFEARPTPATQPPTLVREIPTAVILRETPTIAIIQVTEFSFRPISANEVGIIFCTKGRPVGTTLRVSVYKDSFINPKADPNQLEKDKWEVIKELGVPCFNTNQSSPDWPIWRIDSFKAGNYLIMGEARPAEASGDWNHQSVAREYRQFALTKP